MLNVISGSLIFFYKINRDVYEAWVILQFFKQIIELRVLNYQKYFMQAKYNIIKTNLIIFLNYKAQSINF